MKRLKKEKAFFTAALLALSSFLMTSCDDSFFENEGDCEVTHVVKFVYDMNLKWADAFPSEVNSVNLYVFDNNGLFVKGYQESGDQLSNPDFAIELDLPVGSYKFLAWCGLDNPRATEESFTVTQPVAGQTSLQDVICSLNTQSVSVYASGDNSTVYSNKRLYFLYYGYMEQTLVDNHDGSNYEYIISLTKDTNHIRIILQELNGDDLNPNDYAITIESANGTLGWNNQLLGNTMITYEPWNQENDEVGVGKIDVIDGSLKYVKGLVADLSSCRLMATSMNDMMLVITNTENGEDIARVPLIQYALLSKRYYELAYGHQMTDQEFLDREDEYVMTFFLANGRWMDTYIDIQQWRIVLHDYGLGQ
ncbi:MAG: FimB/Mfa2 family fimbrial subunit [Paramuribaculum sp.]|nr:FimB/Mfa2 family fimbrial subunit [Paramuribaculum sp.]